MCKAEFAKAIDKMIFPGIKNEKEAGNLWAYLKSFGADGKKKKTSRRKRLAAMRIPEASAGI
jgi:hypothetical protein